MRLTFGRSRSSLCGVVRCLNCVYIACHGLRWVSLCAYQHNTSRLCPLMLKFRDHMGYMKTFRVFKNPFLCMPIRSMLISVAFNAYVWVTMQDW